MTVCFMRGLKIPTENSLYIKRLLLKIFTALSFPDQGLTMMDEFFSQFLGQSQQIRSMITFWLLEENKYPLLSPPASEEHLLLEI